MKWKQKIISSREKTIIPQKNIASMQVYSINCKRGATYLTVSPTRFIIYNETFSLSVHDSFLDFKVNT
jgi:hypothetical protein